MFGRLSMVLSPFLAYDVCRTLLETSPDRPPAGNMMASFTEVTRLRVEGVSFFLLVLFLSALGVQGVWNALTADFPRWSRLSYAKAVGVVVLWALICVPIYVTLSEFQKWRSPGPKPPVTSLETLADPPASVRSGISIEAARRSAIDRLAAKLFAYAEAHEGAFPRDVAELAGPDRVWELPDGSGLLYLYVAGRKVGDLDAILAYEPGLYGNTRHVLFADGSIRFMDVDAIRKALKAEGR